MLNVAQALENAERKVLNGAAQAQAAGGAAQAPRPAPIGEAEAALKAKVARIAHGAFGELEDLARALGFVNYSVRNRLLIGAQLPKARLVQSPESWRALGHLVREGEKGAAILAPSEVPNTFTVRFVYGDHQVEPAFSPTPFPAEDFLPALSRWGREEDLEEGPELAFLRAAMRFAAGRMHRDSRLWEELRKAELWLVSLAVESMMRWTGVGPALPKEVLRRAYGERPLVLSESLRRVGEAATAIAEQVGLAPRRTRR